MTISLQSGDFVSRHIWEFPFCLIAAVCCSVCLAEGFFVPDALLGRILPAILPCLLALLYMTAASYSRRTAAIGSAAAVLILVVFIIVLLRGSEERTAAGLYWFLCIVLTASLYLLTRSRIGCAVAFAAAGLILCGNVFMQYGRHPALLAVGTVCMGVLLILRRYQISVMTWSTRTVQQSGTVLSAMALCLASALIAGGIAVFVIAPLHPPTIETKLVTELSDLPLLEKMGISTTIHLMDPDYMSKQENEETLITSEEGDPDQADPRPDPDQGAEEPQAQQPQSGGQQQVGSPAPAEAISYEHKKYYLLLIPLLLAAVIGGILWGKVRFRKKRTEQLFRAPHAEQIPAIYQYVLGMSERLKLGAADAETPYEYYERIGRRLDSLTGGSGRFGSLSESYMKVAYGGASLSDEECRICQDIYAGLPGRLRTITGRLKYLRYFFFT